ncbi:hypothetical protein ACHAPT_010632 [Fusarium lateritium]
MSGRSAFARKRVTEAKQKQHENSRPRSTTTSSNDDLLPDFPMPPMSTSVTYPRYSHQVAQHGESSTRVRGGWTMPESPMMKTDPRRDMHISNLLASSDDWPQRRATVPGPKIEDGRRIERSGLRTILDKRSDDFRKGLAKTFAFRKKDKEGESTSRGSSDRPHSIASTLPSTVSSYDDDPGPGQYSPMLIQTAPGQASYVSSHHPLPSPPSPQTLLPPIGPPPTSKLPAIPQPPSAPTPQMKRWLGGGRPVGKWNKLRKDPELWDPNGDVLIFLGRKGQKLPSFRLLSHIIEATGSRPLITLLLEGSTEEDMPLPFPPGDGSYGTNISRGFADEPLTPPASERTSIGDYEGQISYEMYFPPPQNLSRIDQLRHRITTRNVFALLCHASIVGLSLQQALSDLHIRLDSYMPPYNDNVSQIVRYLRGRGLDDVRCSPATTVSLLTWAEKKDVRWADGWRECFTHCVGMYSTVEECKDFKYLTPITRALLEKASLEMKDRLHAAEERLAGFEYDDMWSHYGEAGQARGAAERLREMFCGHYQQVYGSWPPSPLAQSSTRSVSSESSTEGDTWLARSLVMALQKDFGALYEYLVNRDIIWDVSEARSGRKWMMVPRSGNKIFEADTDEVPMTDMIIEFDNKHRFPHIPHSYPLLPESISPLEMPIGRAKTLDPDGGRVGALERRVHLAYTESTNLGSELAANKLVEAFQRFEKSGRAGDVDPARARRGRWVLIYGILQTLASVSVDDEKVQHRERVEYHLSPRLEGARIPPWRGGEGDRIGEGAHERSYCWVAEEKWGRSEGDGQREVRVGRGAGAAGDLSPVFGGALTPGPGTP